MYRRQNLRAPWVRQNRITIVTMYGKKIRFGPTKRGKSNQKTCQRDAESLFFHCEGPYELLLREPIVIKGHRLNVIKRFR